MSSTEVQVYEIESGSLEYLPVKIEAFRAGASYDPTNNEVQISLRPIDTDTDDWIIGGWDTINGDYYAQILVGPDGDIELDKGDYDIRAKVIDDPERPILRAGLLRIT